jgi:hypothetical protein
MQPVFILSIELNPPAPTPPAPTRDKLRPDFLRLLQLIERHGLHAAWLLPDPECDHFAAAILAAPGQEIRRVSTQGVTDAAAFIVRGPGWSVLEFVQMQRTLARMGRASRTKNICRLHIDLRELQPGNSFAGLQKIFARFARLRDRNLMISLTPGEWLSQKTQVVAGSSFTISPTNDFASPNNISVRSM